MTTAIISHSDCEKHDAGTLHPESPLRLKAIQQALQAYPFPQPVQFYLAPLATKKDLKRAHAPTYVDWLFSIAPHQGNVTIDPDTRMNPYTLAAALRAAGAAIYAVDLVMSNQAQNAFCNVRPPGHHAERDKAMGFCFFNNVAVAIKYALEKYQLQRIAIVDFDVHHGNGSQDIFQEDPSVLLCSSFEYPFYPGFDPRKDNTHILSVPLPAGTTGKTFRQAIELAWFEKIAAFQPELIFFSAGFDGHSQDPLANFQLEKVDYVWLTRRIAQIASHCCHGKMISVLEGGYHLAALADCVPAHVEALTN